MKRSQQHPGLLLRSCRRAWAEGLAGFCLPAHGWKEVPQVQDVKVHREFGTDEGKRIDLVIDSEAFTIGLRTRYITGLLTTSKNTPK